jgi:hypothetical protein
MFAASLDTSDADMFMEMPKSAWIQVQRQYFRNMYRVPCLFESRGVVHTITGAEES